MRNKFAVFILTHGRPYNVITLRTLERCGYTGPIYLVIDDEDSTAEDYYQEHGDRVIMFSKQAVADRIDEGDNFDDRRTITYARNACFDIAQDLGFKYFIQLDDDYTEFFYKFDSSFNYKEILIKSLDKIFAAMFRFYIKTPYRTIALSQNGDFIGGELGTYGQKIFLARKAMNSFFCSTDRRFQFTGRMNEDVNTYTSLSLRGILFGTVNQVSLRQKASQSQPGGITELYLSQGTYVKSFYSVMYTPSGVKIAEMQSSNKRLHHNVKWNQVTPKILDPKHKKR